MLGAVAAPLAAQESEREVRIARVPRVAARADSTRPWLGLMLGAPNTTTVDGILVEDVAENGPAAKAGIAKGARLQAINGVSLRVPAADADDPAMPGVVQRRLMRTLEDVKAGETVSLTVLADGKVRTVPVKAGSMADLREQTMRRGRGGAAGVREAMRNAADRATIGVTLGAVPSVRDTLGVFVVGVSKDGPAEKAGIVEGDRLQAVNGQELRVAREDAGDPAAAQARIARLQRAIGDVKAGDAVELRVWRDGRLRTVKVTTVKASDLRSDRMMVWMGDDAPPLPPDVPMPPMPPGAPDAPRVMLFRGEGGEAMRIEIDRLREGARRMRRTVWI
jgi:S1-C subfamily serine protease